MHMTVGQSEDRESAPHKFLLHKAKLVPSISCDVEELCILVRERMEIDGNATSQMKLWGTINLKDFSISRPATPLSFYNLKSHESLQGSGSETATEVGSLNRTPYSYSSDDRIWKPYRSPSPNSKRPSPESLRVASYNVLAEFHYPPSQVRYSIILESMLHQSALSDVLVLEEVTDDFLCHLLQDGRIRGEYPFVSNGPPDQPDIDPLPSHLNIVVLSKWSFTWDWVSFRRKHKGSVVLKFDEIGKHDDDTLIPAILATVHLTCGLTDGSVAAKKNELQSIIKYLSMSYNENPWILAGDFNITTSAYTIEAALKKKAISPQTASNLTGIEMMLKQSGLSDSWTVARLENGDSTQFDDNKQHLTAAFGGEQGATFDPTSNPLASAIVGSGFNNRPQRYDRILIKGDLFSVSGFNMFGRNPAIPSIEHDSGNDDIKSEAGGASTVTEPMFASDHWGIRCALKLGSASLDSSSDNMSKLIVPVEPRLAPESIGNSSEVRRYLTEREVFPSEADTAKREQALKLLKDILLTAESESNATKNRSQLQVVVVPVGSYGLGVWTTSSDIDCLCIGPISSKTFFALATQRLRKAATKDIKILRRVNAHSGTMLELEVEGTKMDLQYCPSIWIAETWPQAMKQPTNSPVFTLPTQTLAKLKPVRDLYYVLRTIPDFAAFRAAYHLIKVWAKQRGIYSPKFGYLGGIHISILLSRVCKLLSCDGGYVSIPTIITTFFNHYAHFDWKNKMVFDPFFHKRLRYTRTAREPMVILGYHAPSLNTAHTASLPSVRTISEELGRADRLLSTEGISWPQFLGRRDDSSMTGVNEGSSEFLKAYKSYVKIDVQFWGVSLAKGSQYVGWLESRCVMLLVGKYSTSLLQLSCAK
jgi:poly(A) polymerase Pap1